VRCWLVWQSQSWRRRARQWQAIKVLVKEEENVALDFCSCWRARERNGRRRVRFATRSRGIVAPGSARRTCRTSTGGQSASTGEAGWVQQRPAVRRRVTMSQSSSQRNGRTRSGVVIVVPARHQVAPRWIGCGYAGTDGTPPCQTAPPPCCLFQKAPRRPRHEIAARTADSRSATIQMR
jgi:hypothetical protein